jgi:hypothetical protein
MSAIASISGDDALCEIADMPGQGANALYERLMAIKPQDLSLNAWALKAGVNRTIFNDVRKRGNIRHDSLEKLLGAAGVGFAEFDAGQGRVRTEVRGTGMSPEQVRDAWMLREAKPVPLLGTAFGKDIEDLEDVETTELRLAEVLDYLARPPSLAEDPEAYAVEIIGDSMAPRFEPGEHVFVSPKATVHIGDDVIVQLVADESEGSDIAGQVTEVLIKRMVRRTGSFVELRQFNPDKSFRVPAARVRHIHRVKGRL